MDEGTTAERPWDAPVRVLDGVGAERAVRLERLGIRTVGDLLLHAPRRYEDRRRWRAIGEVREKGVATVCGRVIGCGVKYFRRRTRSVYEVILEGDGARLHCRWWNMPYLEGQHAVGEVWLVHGRVVDLKPRTIDHPEMERMDEGEEGGDGGGDGGGGSWHMGRIVPIYPLTEGLTQRWMRGRVGGALERWAGTVGEPHPGLEPEGMPSRSEALWALHFPGEMDDAERARRRLAYDEWVALQVSIQTRRRRLFARVRGLACGGDNRWIRPFLGRLGFELTAGQKDVLRVIRGELGGPRPMRRLLQGDVGSGKTVVAALAALMTIESGYSAVLMAPTEILVRQHAMRFREWFEPLGIRVGVWTGGEKVPLEGKGPGLVVGTHALAQSGFAPEGLGLAIIDEQHRFGVGQREALLRKGVYPHLLVMTATPIPRTLALTLYGDLDVSRIEGMPPGRGRVRTFVRTRDRLEAVWGFVREQVAAGRQAYVVLPRVEEDEAGEVKAVLKERDAVVRAMAPHRVEVLHGRMASEEKDRVMTGFREGRVGVLLTTVVIEVGVDVANATVMVIENAERFGLSQLHQLRGRIGRGEHGGFCILMAGKDTEEARERLKVLEGNKDGWAIAEADLRWRGPGELLGRAQSGMPAWRFADLARDGDLIEAARGRVASALAAGESVAETSVVRA
ncbi:MAG: ATP-dependent DNA helicase RecG [Verrucomicrobiae bacterium]|nr:ATP-dependent DNA helicase RecG [Verrucomicrobiae bacterium]